MDAQVQSPQLLHKDVEVMLSSPLENVELIFAQGSEVLKDRKL